MPLTLVVASLVGLVVAAVYIGIGVVVARRAVMERNHALGFFALFWLGVGTYALADAAWAFSVAGALPPLAVGVLVLNVKVLAGVAGFMGLVYYMLYIYTGRRALLPVVVAFYGGVYALVTYFYAWRDAIGQRSGVWGASLVYANESALFWNVVVLALFVPPLIATLSYALLLRVASTRLHRMRVLVVSLSLSMFFAGVTMGWISGRWYWWGLAEKLLALAAAVAVLVSMTLLDPRSQRGHAAAGSVRASAPARDR